MINDKMPISDLLPSSRHLLFMAILLVTGLALDNLFPFMGQIFFSIIAWVSFLFFYEQIKNQKARFILMSCLVIATLGELFCSLVWGLYTYRLENIPHYVPVGHVFMFLFSLYLAPRLPNWIIYLVPVLVVPYVLAGYMIGFDEFGVILAAFLVACVINAPTTGEKKMYITTFMLSLCLEIYGTYLGNWAWLAEVPYWSLSNTSPPLASGAFYCVLDFLIIYTLSTKQQKPVEELNQYAVLNEA